MAASSDVDWDCIIVGAGFAGLQAASLLSAKGLKVLGMFFFLVFIVFHHSFDISLVC